MYMHIHRERWSAKEGIVFLAAQILLGAHACACACVHACMCACVYVCVYVCVFVGVCVRVHESIHIFLHINMYVYIRIHVYMCDHTISQENMYRFVSQNTILCACGACASMCVFIYIHIDTHPNIFPKPTTTPRYKHMHTGAQTHTPIFRTFLNSFHRSIVKRGIFNITLLLPCLLLLLLLLLHTTYHSAQSTFSETFSSFCIDKSSKEASSSSTVLSPFYYYDYLHTHTNTPSRQNPLLLKLCQSFS